MVGESSDQITAPLSKYTKNPYILHRLAGLCSSSFLTTWDIFSRSIKTWEGIWTLFQPGIQQFPGQRGAWRELTNQASRPHGSHHGRSNSARSHLQNVVLGHTVLRSPLIPQPVLLVPHRALVHHGDFRADSGGAAGAADGRQDHRPRILQRHAMGIHAESRAIQCEGACSYHHFRQLRRRHRLRHPRCDCSQGVLQAAHQFLCFPDCRHHNSG